jgi:hypothetical protein
MQHAVHKQIRVLKSLIAKYKLLGEFDYVTEKIAERQLKELEIMRKEWEKEEREECRKGPAPVKTLAPTADTKKLADCSAAFKTCIGKKRRYADCKKDRNICEENVLIEPDSTHAPRYRYTV